MLALHDNEVIVTQS